MDYEMASYFILQYVLTFIVFSVFEILYFRKSIWIKMLPLLLLVTILLITFPLFNIYLILFTIPTIESCLIVTIIAVAAECFLLINDNKKGSREWRNLLFIGFSLLFLYVLLRAFLWVKMFT